MTAFVTVKLERNRVQKKWRLNRERKKKVDQQTNVTHRVYRRLEATTFYHTECAFFRLTKECHGKGFLVRVRHNRTDVVSVFVDFVSEGHPPIKIIYGYPNSSSVELNEVDDEKLDKITANLQAHIRGFKPLLV